ncbi:MAG: 6-phosphofructokinase, partial [Acidobacteriota bacterium]
MQKRVGLLTGGGDVPGVNSAIKSFVWTMEDADWEVVGLRRGWAALLNVIPDNPEKNASWVTTLTRTNTRTIDRSGGTVLHSSRVTPEIVRADRIPEHLRSEAEIHDGKADLTRAAIRVIEHLRLDHIVAIGGDGTLAFARRLAHEGVPVIAIPKTMDNDVFGTEYCIGFSTAISRSVQFINDLRTVAGSHERFLVVELFGRYSGETCLLASYLAGTDRALIAEVPFDMDRLFELLSRDKSSNPSNYAVLAVSEGAIPIGGGIVETGEPDDMGRRMLGGIGNTIGDYLVNRSGEKVIYQRLGYLMRSGAPDSLDQLVAKNYGKLAADLVLSGQIAKMVAIEGGRYTAVPLERSGQGIKRVDIAAFYEEQDYR